VQNWNRAGKVIRLNEWSTHRCQMKQMDLKTNCEEIVCNMVSVSYLICFSFKILLFGLMLTVIL
jgi:hypothetical protein